MTDPGMHQFWLEHADELVRVGWDVQMFARNLVPLVAGADVLEVGCGAGGLASRLAARAAQQSGNGSGGTPRVARAATAAVEGIARQEFAVPAGGGRGGGGRAAGRRALRVEANVARQEHDSQDRGPNRKAS